MTGLRSVVHTCCSHLWPEIGAHGAHMSHSGAWGCVGQGPASQVECPDGKQVQVHSRLLSSLEYPHTIWHKYLVGFRCSVNVY